MKILSNVEFEILAKSETPRLRALSRSRCDADPKGFLHTADLNAYVQAMMYSGDKQATTWLKNLQMLAKNGDIRRARVGDNKFELHVAKLNTLYRNGEMAFKLGDSVMVKENGKYGQVIDYFPEDKEFLVVLDPFQIKQMKAKDLEKVAHVEKASQEVNKATEEDDD